MAPGRARDEQKERQWRRWIAQWQTSGLSVRDFCARHGLTTANFYAWRRTCRRWTDRCSSTALCSRGVMVDGNGFAMLVDSSTVIVKDVHFTDGTVKHLVHAMHGSIGAVSRL